MNNERRMARSGRWLAGGCVLALALAAGCLSTPERRIAQAPAVFAAFPPDVQAKVRRGEVDIGFTPDMVRLALGGPSRVLTRRTGAGEVEVWIYTAYRYGTDVQPVLTERWYHGRDGRLYPGSDTTFVSVDTREEYPALRLEFEGGRVRAIERSR